MSYALEQNYFVGNNYYSQKSEKSDRIKSNNYDIVAALLLIIQYILQFQHPDAWKIVY